MSSKKVRLQLEEKLDCDLLPRKKEIDELVMACINQEEEEDDDEDEDDASNDDGGDSDYSAEEVKPSKKRSSASAKKATPKKRKYSSDEDDSADSDSGSDYKPSGPAAKGKKKAKKGSDDDSDDDYKVPKKAKAAKKVMRIIQFRTEPLLYPAVFSLFQAGGGGTGKGTGFTRPLKLSPALAELMGTEELPRHAVVKKMWEIIKSRNLYDPKNKQFAICDEDLLKVMGVKRFRTFGMLKYLKGHFIVE